MKIPKDTPLHQSMNDFVKDMSQMNRELERHKFIILVADLIIRAGCITIIGIVILKLMNT